jgi:hypothetical protein
LFYYLTADSSTEVLREGKYAGTVDARSVQCYWANRELGISTVELARRLKIAQPTVTQSLARGEKAVSEKRFLVPSCRMSESSSYSFFTEE